MRIRMGYRLVGWFYGMSTIVWLLNAIVSSTIMVTIYIRYKNLSLQIYFNGWKFHVYDCSLSTDFDGMLTHLGLFHARSLGIMFLIRSYLYFCVVVSLEFFFFLCQSSLNKSVWPIDGMLIGKRRTELNETLLTNWSQG